MIAIDSSGLIDLLGASQMADAAEVVSRDALGRGPVAVCDVVVVEVRYLSFPGKQETMTHTLAKT